MYYNNSFPSQLLDKLNQYAIKRKQMAARRGYDPQKAYKMAYTSGLDYWSFISANNGFYEALTLWNKYFLREETKAPQTPRNEANFESKTNFELGREIDIEYIQDKMNVYLHSTKCQAKKDLALKNAVEKAWIFIANNRSEINNPRWNPQTARKCLSYCTDIVRKYENKYENLAGYNPA